MQRYVISSLVILMLLVVSASAGSEDLMTTRVVDVVDGDSILGTTPNNQKIEIKLYGIDCPEEGQPFGDEAKQFTMNQCLGKIIFYRLVGIDIYQRTIAVVYLEDGRELNLELLKAGLAWHAPSHLNRQDYAQAEAETRKAGTGLWGGENPVPPWEWRQMRPQN